MEDVEKAENSPQVRADSTNDDNVHDSSNNDQQVVVAADGLGSVDVQVAVNEQPIEPAPPYSLMSKVKAARQEAGDDWKAFIFQFIIIMFSSVYAVIFLAITVVIPIAMIAIGSIYVRDCPRERYIPIYLIVGGCFAVVSQLMRIFRQLLSNKDEEGNSGRPHPLEGILSCFLFAWFIAGNVWVYRIHGDYTTENPQASDYCHPTLYLFSFWLITATYILIAAGCCGLCLGGLCLALICRKIAS